MDRPMISVIVPVYKIEPYLRPCVDSILAQTYDALEVILVDDGSPDGCPAICDEYEAADARVTVLHKENGGLSDARNAGLRAAKGDYVAFVDGDDVLAKTFLERLVSAGADIAQCGFCREGEDALAADASFETFSGREMLRRMNMDADGAYTVVWNKLWRRELLEDCFFPVGRQHEDEFFTWRVYWRAASCAVTDAPLYYYRRREDSIMDRGFSPRSLDAVDALQERAETLRAEGDEELAVLTEAVLCHRLRGMMRDIRRALPAKRGEYRRLMGQAYRTVLRSGDVDRKKKISLTVQRISPALYRVLRGGKKSARAV